MVVVFVFFILRYALSFIVFETSYQFEIGGSFPLINAVFQKPALFTRFQHILFMNVLHYYDMSATTRQCIKARPYYLNVLRLKLRSSVIGNDSIVYHL
jgi:hypothetical protein